MLTCCTWRIGKELTFYEQELQKQQARIDGLVASGADIHDVRKQVLLYTTVQCPRLNAMWQTEVLKETQDIFPDVRRRLQTSHAELSELVDLIAVCLYCCNFTRGAPC